MTLLRKIVQPFYTTYIIILFITGLIITFPVFLILGAKNNTDGRKAIYKLVKFWIRIWLWLIGMPVKVIGKPPPLGKYIIVANHISYLDTLVIFPAIPGYFRALGKKEVSKIPVIGFIYKQLVILVDRSNAYSRAKSMRLLWHVLHHESNIVIFPEGTFNETGNPLKEFYDGAFRLAINTQVPIFPIILPDTVERWHYSKWWKFWPGPNRAIYLEPIPVSGLTLNDLPALKEKVYMVMQCALQKYSKAIVSEYKR